MALNDQTHTGCAKQYQRNVGHHTYRDYMTTLQPLPQHESILRADRYDQTGAGAKAGKIGG